MSSERRAEAADPPSSGIPPSSLPWGQIPRFDPSTTDLRVYTQKLQFLHQVWPTEYIEHLAPRAALLVEGAAFQKLARLDAQKLRSADGVKILIETLGGAWGRTDPEDTYDLFERALYSVSQRSDETNDSYLARHDTVFEDLLSKKITLADVRAYVLVRQSNLSSDDRKRIIVDNQGQLTYEQARKSLRLLGSRFFQDLQGNRANHGKKTYEAYQLDEPEDNHQAAFMQETESMEIDEEQIFQLLADQGDEDAVFISDFEDQIVDAIQDHPGLSQCFLSYQEARARGFLASEGKDQGERRQEGKTVMDTSQWIVADRIANSTCRAYGQPGHWKRECPNRPDVKKNEATNITEEIHLGTDDVAADIFEVVSELPEDAVSWSQDLHDQQLTFRIDPKLSTTAQYPESAPAEIQRPPGISTLREWGQLKVPSGKFGGKTFEQAHSDLCYVRQMWNRKAVSAWVRSFQMYCRARSQATHEYAYKMQEQGIEVDLVKHLSQVSTGANSSFNAEPKPISKPKTPIGVTQEKDKAGEWIKIEEEMKSTNEHSRAPKRVNSKPKASAMAVEPNHHRVQEIRTQIAILERELAKEVQIPEEEELMSGTYEAKFDMCEDLFGEFQMMVPELQLKLVMLCRGTERIVPKSGPDFESLEPGQKSDLRRLHANLGHPHPGKLAKLLIEQGADEAVVKAARRIMDEQIKPACKNFVQLEGVPEEEDETSVTNPISGIPGSAADGSQPEGEIFPSAAPSSVSPCPSLLDDSPETPEEGLDFNAPIETPVPEAKNKEIDAWVKHETVKKVARGTLRDDQIMRCRWILTWKPPAPGTSERRAKARLVVLGFEDPQISSISADAPTLSKDGKQLVLQQVASNGWRLVNFDIATAFLKGQGDGRALGLHAPKELKEAIGMGPNDQCSLLGGAYGRADAPILWYRTLRKPDISAKVGELQAAIPCGRVEHLILANRVLFEAKTKPVNLMIIPIAESKVTFCAFSDASFESGNGNPTRQGTLIFTTDGNLAKNQRTVICPMAWSSKKIPRVVRSTLSAESVALGSTLDRLSWLRVFWEWMKNPGIDWSQPDVILRRAPHATVATDCKSVYDLSTKTSTPSCSEYRTTLECLLIRERLRENCGLRWVNSRAMLADCLTKSMDGDALRQALMIGQYALFDEHEVLKERADK
ncbi:unnamed protein product, partial [Cladocopium goreaui]